MTVKLYTLTSSRSSRKAEEFLEDNNIPFVGQSMIHEPLTQEQLFEILSNSENGVEDILSKRSKDYQELTKEGIDFDELKLTELHKLIEGRPRMLRAPIMVKNQMTLVGYHEEEINMLINREDKRKEFQRTLKKIRAMENREFVEVGKFKMAKQDMKSGAYEKVI